LFRHLCCTTYGVATHRPLLRKLEIMGLRSLRAEGRCRGWRLYNRVSIRALPIHLFRLLCCTTYGVATQRALLRKLEIMGLRSLRAEGRCRGWKLYHRVSIRALPIHLFRHFCCRMCRYSFSHNADYAVTSQITDIIMPIGDHTARRTIG